MPGLINIDPKGILDGALDIFNRFFPDKSAEEKQALAAQFQNELQQLLVNQQEAASPNWFVAGWRPYIGWICGTGLGYQFLFMPIGNAVAKAFGHGDIFESLDISTLIEILMGMLGLSTQRMLEKKWGVQQNH